MPRLVHIVLVLVVAGVIDAHASDEHPRSDEALIQGLWRFEDYREHGHSRLNRLRGFGQFVIQVSKNRISFAVLHEGKHHAVPLTGLSLEARLDATKTPKQFDLVVNEGEKSHVYLFLYSLTGDKLILCYTVGQYEHVRPQRIPKSTKKEDGVAVCVFKRVRPNDGRR